MGTFYSPLTIDAHTFSAHTFTVHLSANLLPRTPTHTTKICRRKIEKFLARKQNCDEKSVKLLDDGRFDFQGDIEGVLEAVRGKDGGSRRRGGGDKKKKVNTETGFRKTSRKVTKNSSYNQNQPINLQQMPAQMQMQMQTDPMQMQMQMQMQMNGVAYEPYFSGDVDPGKTAPIPVTRKAKRTNPKQQSGIKRKSKIPPTETPPSEPPSKRRKMDEVDVDLDVECIDNFKIVSSSTVSTDNGIDSDMCMDAFDKNDLIEDVLGRGC